MKNQLVFTCFLLVFGSVVAFGQSDFAAIGTQWTYSQWVPGPNPAFGTRQPYYMQVDSEVVFQGRLCRRIIGGRAGWPQEPLFYLYNQGDSVFCWNTYNHWFNLLYDFSAETGDSWEIEMPVGSLPDGDTSISVFIDSTGYTIQNNDTLKVWYITYDEYADWGNTIIEGIGNTCYLVPSPDLYEFNVCGLRCFENTLTDVNFVNYPCDSIVAPFISSSEDAADTGDIKIYPNPAFGQVTLEYPSMTGEILQLELFDLTGRLVRSERFHNNGNYTFDTSGLPNGMYSLRLLNNGQVLENMKLSIMH